MAQERREGVEQGGAVKFITVGGGNGYEALLNIDHIISVVERDNGSVIHMLGNIELCVRTNYNEVVKRIQEASK